jgi:hypothetical protein
MHGGAFKKSISVESNAVNNPKLSLTIEGVIVPAIEVRTSYVTLKNKAGKDENPAIVLRSKKADLRVGDLVFEPGGGGPAPSSGWRTFLPVLPVYETIRSEKPGADGLWEYTIKLEVGAELAEPLSGNFRLTTNHKDKPEITIGGRIALTK